MTLTIDNLSSARLEAGKSYELAAKTHTITAPVSVPDNVSIEAGDATIVYANPARPPVWYVGNKKNVRISGGSYRLGKQNYVAFLEHGINYYLEGATLKGECGGLAIVRSSYNVVIQDCSAEVINRYFVFLEGGNAGVVLDQLILDKGSLEEAGIRIRESSDVTISNCDITANLPGKKNSCLRMQDGENIRVIGGRYFGGFGAGPLADGDGGRNETDPVKRASKIGKRLKNVLVIGAHIDGPITLEAGLENFKLFGGTITTPTVFTGTTWRYPEKDEWTKPGDVIRPQAQGAMYGATITGDIKDNPVDLLNCTVNGKRVSVAAVKK